MDLNRANAASINDEERRQILERFDLAGAAPLAVGTEAEVYHLGETTLLKLYADASRLSYFETLRTLYDNVDTTKSGLRLPRIHDIVREDNLIAVIESRLEGEPLAKWLPDLDGEDLDRVERLYLDAAWALKTVELEDAPETYLLFDAARVSAVAQGPFEIFYADFVEQKLARVGEFFQSLDPSFADKSPALVDVLRARQCASLALVHGDFFPGNVIVNETTDRVNGIIDFGSFTLFGNYLLDIAGAFGFYKMYHPDRTRIRERMLAAIMRRLAPHERPVFFQFLLANAILTSDLYANDPDPRTDDHFRWAAEIVADERYWARAL